MVSMLKCRSRKQHHEASVENGEPGKTFFFPFVGCSAARLSGAEDPKNPRNAHRFLSGLLLSAFLLISDSGLVQLGNSVEAGGWKVQGQCRAPSEAFVSK